jgi:hypothetical protein
MLPVVPNSIPYVIVILAVAGSAAFYLIPRWRRQPQAMKIGLGLALLTALPFLPFIRTGMRLLYLPSAGLAIALASVLLREKPSPRQITLLWIWIAIMSVSFVEQSSAWWESGRLARRVLDSAEEIRRAVPPGQATVFVDVPSSHRGAMVLSIGFTEGVKWRTDNQYPLVFEYGNVYADTTGMPDDARWYQWTEDQFLRVPRDSIRIGK